MSATAPQRLAFLGAALALLAGLACYLWLRPVGVGPALLLGSTPALTHAFAFAALLLLAARPHRLRHRRWLLGGWLALLVGFEALQLPAAQPWVSHSVQALEGAWPYLASLLRAHGAGTFDTYDVLASAVGVALAACLLRPARPTDPRRLIQSRESHAASS
ncbi:MAG: hypothetical protein AAF184_19770 [Pseudomonadota bacterium]